MLLGVELHTYSDQALELNAVDKRCLDFLEDKRD